MANLNMDNFEAITVDEKKIGPGKQNARMKVSSDEITLVAEISIGDEFLMAKIPETAVIIDAYIDIPASLGTAGKVDFGLKEYIDLDGNTVAEDFDSLVFDADGGGQAALKRADLNSVALLKQVGKGGAQPFLRCSEASDAAIGDSLKAVVIYSMS